MGLESFKFQDADSEQEHLVNISRPLMMMVGSSWRGYSFGMSRCQDSGVTDDVRKSRPIRQFSFNRLNRKLSVKSSQHSDVLVLIQVFTTLPLNLFSDGIDAVNMYLAGTAIFSQLLLYYCFKIVSTHTYAALIPQCIAPVARCATLRIWC